MVPYNRYLYIAFVVLGVYFLVTKDPSWDSVSFLGLALAFDPFDQNQAWGQRPFWQRAILLGHLILVFCIIGSMLFMSMA